ncbi:hypothetical protein [Hyphomicrobium sp.]|uniref:hypothetical protein n=1 Tax=Hyphomicrobium sp. TaxID=82 RepID=UPI003F714818
MKPVREMALGILHIVAKAVVVRAFAVGPVSRRQEAELRAFLASAPAIWGSRSRAKD